MGAKLGSIPNLHDSEVEFGVPTMLLDLNDDCLESILEHIHDLRDQIRIAKCCPRFLGIVKRRWIRQSNRGVLDYTALRYSVNYDDWKFYLAAMRTEIHTIKYFRFELIKEVINAGIQYFPCAERCEFLGEKRFWPGPEDELKSLSKLMPYLKCLGILKPITGKYLTNFPFLEELYILDEFMDFSEISGKYLQEILTNLKYLRVLDVRAICKTDSMIAMKIPHTSKLEILRLDSDTLEPMINNVLQLPQLRQLVVGLTLYPERSTNLFRQIVRQRGEQLQGIMINVCSLHMDLTWLTECYFLLPETIQFLYLSGIKFYTNEFKKCQFLQLHTLCLSGTEIQADDILELVRQCPTLQRLDISFNLDLDGSFLKDIWDYWRKERSNQVLHLYYCGTYLDSAIKEDSIFWATQKNFKFMEHYLHKWNCDLYCSKRKWIGFYF